MKKALNEYESRALKYTISNDSKIYLKLIYLMHWYTFPSNTNIIIGNTCYKVYQTIYQKGKEFIGKVFFLLREKLLPSLNLRYINISLKNISFLLKWKDWKWNCLGNERKYWPICLTYFKGPYSIDFLSRRREYWMFPFCINSMFDILLQKRNVRRRAKNISMKKKDKMSHYVVMNDKNVKINFSLIFNRSSWSKKWLFAWFVIFLWFDICYLSKDCFGGT